MQGDIVRTPDVLVRRIFQPLWDVYEGSIRLRTLRELEKSQWHSRHQLQEAANHKLRRMCRHAVATSAFYRRRFAEAGIDPAGVRSIADLADLPLLTKADVRENLDDLLSTSYRREDLTPAKTGGSTGVSLNVFCDARGIERRNAAALRSDRWSGWEMGQPLAAVWGNPPTPTTLKNKLRWHLKDRIIYLDTMRIDDAAIENFIGQWRRVRPGLLFGHAHSIFILAEALRRRGVALRPTGIVATSMMLLEPERKVIEQVFGVPVTNRYGCEEVSLIGCECEQHHGMHLNLDHNIVEFLDDGGKPCAAGQDGRIVVTELINFGMPMIRYEVGDRGVPSDRACPCGRGLPLMESITGRTADFLVASDGSRVAGISIIENSLTRFAGIRQLQIIQEEPLLLIVNVVYDADADPQTEAQLLGALRGMLGESLQFTVNHVPAIPQEKSGKYRFTICRL
ncbi:adenylyltransferase [bacterium DOLZORAL124_64_63]|nr:MAG: adenylyltransferase [bacterium DOLZORAL124_64_63]